MKNTNNTSLFIFCRSVSLIGDEMQSTVIPILILELTKSGKSFANFISLQEIFILIFTIIAGYLSDLLNRKTTVVLCDFINGSITLLFLLFFSNNFYIIFIFQVSQIFFSKIFITSSSVLLVEITPPNKLLKVKSLLNMTNKIIEISTPALAFILYSNFGIKIILIINTFSFFISGFLEIFIKYEYEKQEKKVREKNIFISYLEVFKYIYAKKEIIRTLIFMFCINFFLNPIFTIVVPYIIKLKLNLPAEYIGFFFLFLSLGVFFGNIIIQKFPNINLNKYIEFNTLFCTITFIFINIAFYNFVNTQIYLSIIGFLVFVYGCSNILLATPIFIYFDLNIDKNYLGKFYSLGSFLTLCSAPFTFYITGVLISKFNPSLVSIYYLISFLIFYFIFFRKKLNL